MRLVDADRLIRFLNDYALSESPAHDGDDDSVYKAIMNCIETVGDAETMTDTNVVRLIFDQDGTAHGYDEKYTVSILHETAEEMEDTKQLLKNLPRWVPTKEELPERPTKALICNARGDIDIAAFNPITGDWINVLEPELYIPHDETDNFRVVAWMLLPEAYKEEQGKD